MNKFLISFLLFVFGMTIETYADTTYILHVKLTDNSELTYNFADEPTLVTGDTYLTIKSGNIEVKDSSILYSNISNLYCKEEGRTDIMKLSSESGSDFSYNGSNITLRAGNSSERVALYSVSGREVESATVSANGNVSMDISHLPQGTYILRTSNKSYKIFKR